MHDIKTLKATPGLARRLLAFSQMNHMNFDEKIVDLAMQDLLSPKDLKGFPYPIDNAQLSSLQFVRDWNSRAIILCSAPDRARSVALANAWMEGGRTLIMAQPKFYGQWAELVKEVWPEAKISVFGNPRYHEKEQAFPAGVDFSEKPDFEADVFITSYGGLVWHNFFNYTSIDQAIIEELDNQSAMNYKWQDAVKGIFHEIPKPVFIQNINNLPNDSGRDNMTSLQTNGSKALSFVREQITDLLWAGMSNMGVLMYGQAKDVEDYLVSRGYTGMDNLRLLGLFAVSSHLLDSVEGHKKPIVFQDHTIKFLNEKRRRESGLGRMVDRERAVEESAGRKMPALVRDAIEGDRPSQTLIGGLMTSQWANLKGQHLKVVHGNLANRASRCLFLTNNVELKRALGLQFGLQIEDLSKTPDRDYMISRFIYPQILPTCYPMPHHKYQAYRPLSNLIVSLDDLIQDNILLNSSNFLFVGEHTMDRDFFEGIKAAAEVSGTRVVHSVITDTFEEEIYSQLR